MSICVRFDPKGLGVIGDVNRQSLAEIWNGEQRLAWLARHQEGRRDLVPLCSYCHFWGVPSGWGDEPMFAPVDEARVLIEDRVPKGANT